MVTQVGCVCGVGQKGTGGWQWLAGGPESGVRLMVAIEQNAVRATLAAAHRPLADQPHPGRSKTEGRVQRLLPVGDAANYLGVSRATVERLVFRGELPIVKIGGSTRYDVDDLDGYIAINRSRSRRRTA
jgi:excisionase family DNA binding protein